MGNAQELFTRLGQCTGDMGILNTDEAVAVLDAALREAERRGMMRALAAIAPTPGGVVRVPDDLDVISYARGYADGTEDAQKAIESAATAETD